MSFSGEATPSTSPIIDALADYAQETGIDLANDPVVAILKRSNSPQAVLQLLQEREKAFKEYRDGSRRLMNILTPVVKVLQALSGILDKAASLVSQSYHYVNPQRNFVRVRSPSRQQAFCLLVLMLSLLYVSRIRV